MGSSVREPRIGGSSNTLQGVRESMARAITLQAISWKWMEATSLWVVGEDPTRGVSHPHARRSYSVLSLLELSKVTG